MDDNFQYFDKVDLLHTNGENYLTLIDQKRNTSTPIRLHSVTFGSNNSSKWVVTVIPNGGCEFRFRKIFDTEECAKVFAENIRLLANKTGVQRLG